MQRQIGHDVNAIGRECRSRQRLHAVRQVEPPAERRRVPLDAADDPERLGLMAEEHERLATTPILLKARPDGRGLLAHLEDEQRDGEPAPSGAGDARSRAGAPSPVSSAKKIIGSRKSQLPDDPVHSESILGGTRLSTSAAANATVHARTCELTSSRHQARETKAAASSTAPTNGSRMFPSAGISGTANALRYSVNRYAGCIAVHDGKHGGFTREVIETFRGHGQAQQECRGESGVHPQSSRRRDDGVDDEGGRQWRHVAGMRVQHRGTPPRAPASRAPPAARRPVRPNASCR